MAPPTRYQRDYSFSGFQATNPAKPLPGPALDNELTNIERSIDGTISSLGLIQRTDGALRNGIVTNEALAPDLQTGIAPAVPWATSVQYTVGAVVFFDTAFYRCVVAHISTDFATDLAAGKWVVSADLTPIVADAIAARDDAEAAAATATTQAGIATTGANTATTQAGIATAAAAAASNDADTAATQAGIATTGANTATTQAGIATVAAAAAETARDEAVAATASKMDKAANLSDVANVATARTNLELGGAAVLNVGTASGTVAAGNDTRIVGAVQRTGDTMTGALSVNTNLRLGRFNGSSQIENTLDNTANRVLDLADFPNLTTAQAAVRLFRTTNTSGQKTLDFYRGDNTATIDHRLTAGSSGTVADLARNGGNVLINGQTAWHAGNTTGVITDAKVAAGAAIAPTKIKYLGQAADAVQMTLEDKLRQSLDATEYGVTASGSDTDAAFKDAVAAAKSLGRPLRLPPGIIGVTSSTAIDDLGIDIIGTGQENCAIKALGNFAEVLKYAPGGIACRVQGVKIDTTGTTTRCVTIEQGAYSIKLIDARLMGDLTGDLLYSKGDIVELWYCNLTAGSANTVCAAFDEYNQNCSIVGGIVGGTGKGIEIRKSGAGPRVEGLKIIGLCAINTGAFNVAIGDSLMTTVQGCVLDQASSNAVYLGPGSTNVTLGGNWMGGSSPFAGVGVYIDPTTGGGHVVDGNIIAYFSGAVIADASASARIRGLTISNNVFNCLISVTPLSLDSVALCSIVGNVDLQASATGSWITKATNAAGGDYSFSGNKWWTAPPSLFHAASSYRFNGDTGIVGDNSGGVIPGAPATSIDINHGLFTTPTTIQLQMGLGNVGVDWWSAVDATKFTANWEVSAQPHVGWSARVGA